MSKRQKTESPIDKLLQEADRVAEEDVIQPTEEEKKALSTYCTICLQCKKIEQATKAETAPLKPQCKQLRTSVTALMQESTEQILALPQSIRDEHRRLGLTDAPCYIRLFSTSKETPLSYDKISDILRELDASDFADVEEDDSTKAFIEAAFTKLKRDSKSVIVQAKLTDSIPRGIKPLDIAIACTELSQQSSELYKKQDIIAQKEKAKREQLSSIRENLEQHKPAIDIYFTRGNMNSQRVLLEEKAYNLTRRVSVLKPKITYSILQSILHDGIQEVVGTKTKKQLLKCYASKKQDILELVLTKLSSLPSTSKTSIHLVSLRKSS